MTIRARGGHAASVRVGAARVAAYAAAWAAVRVWAVRVWAVRVWVVAALRTGARPADLLTISMSEVTISMSEVTISMGESRRKPRRRARPRGAPDSTRMLVVARWAAAQPS